MNCPKGLYWEMAEIREKAITDAQAVDILKGLLVAQPLLPVTDLGKAIMRAINKLEMQKTDSNVARDILADMDTLFEQKAFVDYHVLFDTFRQRVRSKYGIA